MNTITTSSLKLNFNNIIEVKPWIILSILGEEFVTTNDDVTGLEQVGIVRFGKVDGKILRFWEPAEHEQVYYIALNDSRTYKLTENY